MSRDLKFTQEILVLLRTLMPVKLPLQSVFFSTQGKLTKLEKYMKVLLQWTGWNKKQKEVLPLLLLQLLVAGISQQIKENTS
jgi:hypothetical protein